MSQTEKPNSFEIEAYVQQLTAARNRLTTTKHQCLDWLSRLDVIAASEFTNLEPLTNQFPIKKGGETFRVVYDIHSTAKRYGALGVSIRSERMRTDLAKLSSVELANLLRPFFGAAEAKLHAQAYIRFQRFVDQISALRFLGIEIEPVDSTGSVLPRWFDAIQSYGQRCRGPLEAAFDDFIALSADLDDAIFTFNSTMGAVRYRSIRCVYTVDDFDLLGPSSPALKVVTSIDPSTRRRRYNLMVDFKKSLKKKRIGKELRQKLGRDPDKSEIAAAVSALRPRKETEWITKDVIKACYLGRSIKEVFEAQDQLKAVMQPWSILRAQLQALLP